jgi:peptidyl-prolyl cis-trans isomerase SurA
MNPIAPFKDDKTMLKFKVLFVSLFLLLSTLPATAKTISRIVAVVNSDIITSYELDTALDTALKTINNSDSLSDKQIESLKKSTLDRLINNKLFEQRIAELGLTVSDKDIDSAFANVQQQNSMTRLQLIQALAAQGIDLDSYRENLRQEILNFKLINYDVYSKVLITNADIRHYFEQHLADYKISNTLDLNHISIDLNDSNRQTAAAQLTRIREQLRKGKDFTKVLSEAKNDGLISVPMNNMREADLAEPIRNHLKGLAVGEISEPLELAGQLHLFQLIARESDKESVFESVKDDIKKTLQKQDSESAMEKWHKQLRDNADIDIRL